LHANQLKRTARTGWGQRGVPDAENVAAHSFGVVFTALTLAQVVEEPLDLGRLLALAALHDLPEALTTDIPTPAWRYLPPGIKTEVERGAMTEMLAGVPFAAKWMGLWEELHAGQTAVARLVHDADKLEMYLQAWVYEQQTGNRFLAEFWATPPTFYFAEARRVYEEIRRLRDGEMGE
ncbi:MAG TPA: HD domain-containing protein, partial [Chloroflexota bacterium]|nr:HD domain-containing protein [Chloroflexota bacterium]